LGEEKWTQFSTHAYRFCMPSIIYGLAMRLKKSFHGNLLTCPNTHCIVE